jgi:hypothetical protein
MSRSPSSLSPADLRLLYEALAYARRRSFAPVEGIRLQGILDRLDEILLGTGEEPQAAAEGSFRLSPPEQEVLDKQIPLYCEALTQRGASPEGAAEAARLREILQILTGRKPGSWKRRRGKS